MSCSICGKDIKRLKQHLNKMHKIKERVMEPDDIIDFLRLIKLAPATKHRQVIIEYLNTGKPLSEDVCKELATSFQKYKEYSGVKLVIQFGRKHTQRSKQQKHNNDQATMDLSRVKMK